MKANSKSAGIDVIENGKINQSSGIESRNSIVISVINISEKQVMA